MNAILGQRIVRQICKACKIEYAPPAQIVSEMKAVLGKYYPSVNENAPVKFYRGKGCTECGSSGYFGRVGIFETLSISEKIASLVLQRADSGTIEKEAVLEGMITMKQDGYLKVLQGVTSVEEVLRVAQE
jgi:type II secretory ATPase GspE/PulE/Tfp pilus assembly ATPase PilB-like protein